MKNLKFEQTGYAMPYDSTNAFKVKVNDKSVMDIEQGKSNKLCFEKKGKYTLVPQGCHKFEKDSFVFDTSKQGQSFNFKPTAYKLTGKVNLKNKDLASKITI